MPDLIFDLTGNRYSALFARKIGAYTVGMDLAGEAAVLYHFCARISNRKCHHLAMQPIATVCSFSDLPEPENVPDLLLPEHGYNAQTVFQKLDLATDIRPVLIVPGAGWHAKMWSPERFRAVIRYCIDHGKTVLLSAGNETETALCKTLISGLKTDLIRILSDDLPLLVSTFPFLDFCIGNDSGISHLSAAAGVKTIQLFCPTNPVHSKALGKCVTVLRSSCLLKPEGLCKFCTGELNCSRSEQMDISPEKVIAEMERMQHEDRP